MNWALVIEKNRKALLHIVDALFVIAGIAGGKTAATLRRHRRDHILRILRPAESAARRLIVIAAQGMQVTVRMTSAAKRPLSDTVKSGSPKTGVVYPPGYRPPGARQRGARDSGLPLATNRGEELKGGINNAFPLLDPLKRFDTGPRRRYAKSMPRVHALSDRSWPVYMRLPEPPPRRDPTPDDALDAAPVCRRLATLKHVLENIDGQAKRLARWRARRDIRLKRTDPRPLRLSPMRPGWPPGFRKRPIHDIDEVLRECHSLALYALKSPDSG